jgi:uncharacterized repeat protein (TIGR03803 family)
MIALHGDRFPGFPAHHAVLAQSQSARKRRTVARLMPEALERRVLLSGYTLNVVANLTPATGDGPAGGIVMDSSGNIFATAEGGGASGVGSVFEIPAGTSTPELLGSFEGNGPGTNGDDPLGRLLLDSQGDLFGTAESGGHGDNGTVFEVPAGGTITVLGSFDGVAPDGANPYAGVVMDSIGNLYGTTADGGASGEGTIFVRSEGGSLATVASMTQADGGDPQSDLIMDSNHNLFGVSTAGGALLPDSVYGPGQIFQLSQGSTQPLVLATFNFTVGYDPTAGLTLDSDNNFYGTTGAGGANGDGTVYELAAGSSTITPLASFEAATTGQAPNSTLLIDSSGDLFGTTTAGGANHRGTVFEIAKNSGVITTLASFNGVDGSNPEGALVMDSHGDIFGAAFSGGPGSGNYGTVWELTPGTSTASFATLTDGNLLVEGTSGDDVITLQTDGNGNLTATLNGATSQNFAVSQINSIDVEAGAGNDSVTIESSMPATLGVSVQGGPGDDTIMGGPGNDTLGGGAGNDSISGGPGDDSIKGGMGDDVLAGGKGNDTLFGSLGNDTMRGGLGDDSLNGGAGTNQLYGGQGNNTFYAVNGTADQIFAGAATNDSLIYGTSDNYVIESGTIPPGNVTLA